MKSFKEVYKGKTVLVTGHTGFKGSWLTEWLLLLGAKVVGYSIGIPTQPCHFNELGLVGRLKADLRKDICRLDLVQEAVQRHRPDFIFHLAAQSLVGRAFEEPYDTVRVNTLGTLNVLEAVRCERRSCILVMVTTDKVYENLEWDYAYRESDPLGGHDPYSASKASADILISAYRRSFFSPADCAPDAPIVAVATARGGNVIGGGDWAEDRIIPDCVRSLAEGRPIPVRNPSATRPWQHILELLGGYLHLGAELFRATESKDIKRLQELCAAFNFGPNLDSNRTVGALVNEVLSHWPGLAVPCPQANVGHEAGKLNLTIDKAYHLLGWQPRWTFEQSVYQTIHWYRQLYEQCRGQPDLVRQLTQGQILKYAHSFQSGYFDGDLVSEQ